MIKFVNVTKEYPNTVALDDISFEIDDNKITGIIGHNGAGKTTLFMVANGLTKPKSGEVIINEYSLSKDIKKIQSITGLFTDKLHLYNILTVKECLIYFIQIFKRDKHIYNKLVEDFKLESFQKKRISDLSTGMLKKVSLAVSMINSPQVLFLDEPFSGLDPEARHDFGEIIKNVKDNQRVQILISSHDLLELELVIENLMVLKNGKLIASSTLTNLMAAFFKEKKIIVEIYSVSEAEVHKSWNKMNTRLKGDILEKPICLASNLFRFRLKIEDYPILMENLPSGSKIIAMHDHKPTLDELYFKITDYNADKELIRN